jgi:septum formation protein
MITKLILASNSGIRLKILEDNNYEVQQCSSGIDEDEVKLSLIHNHATPLQIAKNLAELKANRISSKFLNDVVIGADQTLDLDGKNIDKPKNLEEAKDILHSLNNQTHMLHSAVCVSRAGSMISHFHDTSLLKMKKLSDIDISEYLEKIKLETMLKYGVYQIEGLGKSLFEKIDGELDSILGLPMKQLKPYLDKLS